MDLMWTAFMVSVMDEMPDPDGGWTYGGGNC